MKNSPRKRKTLKLKTNSNNNGKANGFTKFYKKSVTEKCIFCHDEHLKETFWEGTSQEGPKLLQIPICKRCHDCVRDDSVINEIREAIERGNSKMNGVGKVGFSCGVCQGNIKKTHGSVICTRCSI